MRRLYISLVVVLAASYCMAGPFGRFCQWRQARVAQRQQVELPPAVAVELPPAVEQAKIELPPLAVAQPVAKPCCAGGGSCCPVALPALQPAVIPQKPKSGVKLTVWGTKWCGPCQELAPVLAAIKDRDIDHYDADAFPDSAKAWGVSKVPVLVWHKDGQELGRVEGYQTKEQIEAAFKRYEGG